MNAVWTILGSGNAATRFGAAFQKAGFRISCIFSRTEEAAERLARQIGCPNWTTDPAEAIRGADHVLSALKDSAADEIWRGLDFSGKTVFHTAGSLPLSALSKYADRCGVLYPLQTLSKNRDLTFERIPLLLEGNSPEVLKEAEQISQCLGAQYFKADSRQRKSLHLAAVFANNFSNHMFALSKRIADRNGVPFELLHPLIEETVKKLRDLDPEDAQTGPAVRFDENVMSDHEKMLSPDPRMAEIYRLVSTSIHEKAAEKRLFSEKNQKKI